MRGVLMDKPLVSAICCTHNRRSFVRKAIELFLGQTWPNKELVIMNDGDPADVPDVTGMPIRHVWTSGYEGMTRRQRWGFEIAAGSLLCYWDDDDYFSPRRLELQASAILDGHADAAGFPIDVIASAPGARFWRWRPSTLKAWEDSAKTEKPVGSQLPFHDGSAMFRRELLEGIPRSIREHTQIRLLDAMMAAGADFVKLPNFGHFVYVRHGGNAWKFDLEDRCTEVDRPGWIPQAMIDFWSQQEPARQAQIALAKREKDQHGL